MCITYEDFLTGLLIITAVGIVLGYIWDSFFTHPEDN